MYVCIANSMVFIVVSLIKNVAYVHMYVCTYKQCILKDIIALYIHICNYICTFT